MYGHLSYQKFTGAGTLGVAGSGATFEAGGSNAIVVHKIVYKAAGSTSTVDLEQGGDEFFSVTLPASNSESFDIGPLRCADVEVAAITAGSEVFVYYHSY